MQIGGSCPAFHPPVPPSPSWPGCSQSPHPQSVLIAGVALTHMKDLALHLVEPHEVHTGPLLELVQVLRFQGLKYNLNILPVFC